MSLSEKEGEQPIDLRISREVSLRAMSAPWYRGVEFLLRCGDRMLDPSGVIVDRQPGNIHKPSFVLDEPSAQTLMDDLWAAGLRPTEGRGSAGALLATQGHLQDLQKLVFDHFLPAQKAQGSKP